MTLPGGHDERKNVMRKEPDELWKLFEKTGNVNIYRLYKAVNTED